MGSLIEELRRREAVARAEADRLRSRIEELSEDLARAEEQVTRLAIAQEEVARVLEGPAVSEPSGGQGSGPAGKPRPGLAGRDGDGAAVAGRLGGVGAAAVVSGPGGGSGRRGTSAAGGASSPAAAGLATDKAKVEGLRSKLKRLAMRGWLAEEPGGLFTLPDHAGKTAKPGQ